MKIVICQWKQKSGCFQVLWTQWLLLGNIMFAPPFWLITDVLSKDRRLIVSVRYQGTAAAENCCCSSDLIVLVNRQKEKQKMRRSKVSLACHIHLLCNSSKSCFCEMGLDYPPITTISISRKFWKQFIKNRLHAMLGFLVDCMSIQVSRHCPRLTPEQIHSLFRR